MELAVIYGGNSSERDVSINTAKSIISVIDSRFKITEIDFDGNISNMDHLLDGLKLDLVFNALHGGVGENGDIQQYFEDRKIPFTGSGYHTSRIAMSKHQTKLECLKLDIPTPRWIFIDDGNFETDGLSTSSFIKNNSSNYLTNKIVLKPNDEGSSTDLKILDSPDNKDIYCNMDLLKKYGSYIVEEYIKGRELTVGILGNQVLPVIEILPKNNFYDYECKYSDGMSQYQVPAHLSDELTSQIQYYAYKLHADLGCRHYSRVDFRLNNDDHIYLLEINTLPGMTATSLLPKAAQAYDINFKNLIKNIIDQALKDYLLI